MVFLFLHCLVQGGVYLFELIDYYGCNGTCILFGSLIQCLAVGWAFGKHFFFLFVFFVIVTFQHSCQLLNLFL